MFGLVQHWSLKMHHMHLIVTKITYNHFHFSWFCWAFKGTAHPKHQTATTMDGKSTEVSLFTKNWFEKKRKNFSMLKFEAISTSMLNRHYSVGTVMKCLKHVFFGWIVPLRIYFFGSVGQYSIQWLYLIQTPTFPCCLWWLKCSLHTSVVHLVVLFCIRCDKRAPPLTF